LKVVISTDPIQAPMTGIGEYTLRLIEALLEGDEVDELYAYSRHGPQRLSAPPPVPDATVKRQPDGLARTGLRRVRRLSEMVIRRRVLKGMHDVIYHEPNYLASAYQGPTVVTVHDLSHIHYPQCHPRVRSAALKHLLPRILNEADAVMTVSQHVANEVCEQFGLPESRVHPVHLGVDAAFRPLPLEVLQPVLDQHGLHADQYMLCMATLEPRKNLDRLISAFEGLPDALRARYPLTLAGAPGWRSHALHQRIDRLATRGEVRYLGYVPDTHRPALYAGARLFAYPALYEGFGLPPLEAMACGTPVLTSTRASMPEVAGDAAVTVDPEDVDGITAALARLADDTVLRERLQAAGPRRAASFTWSRCAAQTAAVYHQVAR
jgi:alpha-1,3-rhamnosyl/mannosyltransferase